MRKRIISILLAVIMIIAMMPTVAFAIGFSTPWDELRILMAYTNLDGFLDDENCYVVKIPDEDEQDIEYFSLERADNKFKFTLRNDIIATEGDEALVVPAGRNYILDLNGHVINGEGIGDSVIKISGATTESVVAAGELTIIDSVSTTEHKGYLDANGLWHLGTPTNGETEKSITGGIITGGNALTGGGINNSGTLTMNGGTICGNTATNGGGIYNIGTFTMNGGTICGNTATSGGGIFASKKSVNILTGGEVTGNKADDGGGLFQEPEQCFAAGTLITLNDGSQKPIEELDIDDSVRVFDHDLGDISSAKLFDLWKYPEKQSGAVTLHFTNNDLTIVYGHSFFEREQNKYVTITKDNVSTFIGQEFYNADNKCWEKLIGYDLVDGKVDAYIISTENHLNCIANGMLSVEDGIYTTLSNVFEYGDGLKIDAEGKAADLAKFGLYDFEKIKYVSKHVYDVLNLQYLEVAFGKGLITEKQVDYLASYYVEMDPEFYCGSEPEEPKKVQTLLKMPLMALLSEGHVDPPTEPGVYVGGSVKITENKGGNVYLSSGKLITIGTGTSGNGKGVAEPTDDMLIGITMKTPGAFTIAGSKASAAKTNFSSDNTNYYVNLHDGDDKDETNDYLELIMKGTQDAPVEGEGFTVDRVNLKISPKDGYEIRPQVGKFRKDQLPLHYGSLYFVRKIETDTLFASDETEVIVSESAPYYGGGGGTKPESNKNPFVDVFEKDYFYDPVMWAVENKITEGTDATHFSPDGTTTRAQMVTFLWRMAGSPIFEDDGTKFTDIKKSDYFYDAVVWGWNIGVINGKTEEAFAPDDNVTRGEAVSFIYRYAKVAGGDLPNPFDDIKQGKFYYYPVLWAANNEITKGTSATMFDPENDCTRGQIVTFLYRYSGI